MTTNENDLLPHHAGYKTCRAAEQTKSPKTRSSIQAPHQQAATHARILVHSGAGAGARAGGDAGCPSAYPCPKVRDACMHGA